jgi:hypothetical protein
MISFIKLFLLVVFNLRKPSRISVHNLILPIYPEFESATLFTASSIDFSNTS